MIPDRFGTLSAPCRRWFGFALLAVAALSAGTVELGAQTIAGARLQTLTPYGNFVQEGTTRVFRSLRKGFLVPSPGTTVSANSNNASAATIVGWRVRGNVVSCDVSEQGTATVQRNAIVGGSTAATTSALARQGAHELLLEVRGKPLTRGLVEIWASGIARAGSAVKMGVDVQNNGRFDFTAGATVRGTFVRKEMSATIGRTGALYFRIVTNASLSLRSGGTLYKTGVSVRFTPGVACDAVQYGRTCGPVLTGATTTTGTSRTMSLALTSRSARTSGLLVIGNQRLNIPFGNCFIHTNFLASIPYVTDASGAVVRRFTFPAKTVFALTLQDAIFPGGTTIQTSNGLSIVCK